MTDVDDPLEVPPPDLADGVRRLLKTAGYLDAATRVAELEALPDGTAGVLVKLLSLDLAVPAERAPGLGVLVDAGLVVEDGGWLVPRARVAAVDGLLVAGDPARLADHPDFVTPASATSRTVASLTVRQPASRGLDLCTGSGVLALMLARHCDHVVATDVAARALAWAAFNAALNGLTLDLRIGSLTDPVAGERFDVVCANPPYVVGLEGDLVYRDCPLPGDGVSELVVRALPELLAPSGWAATTLSWAGADGSRPRSWLAAADVEAWLLTGRRLPATEHVLAWIGAQGDARSRGERVERWTRGLVASGTAHVCEGALLVTAAGRRSWREDDVELPVMRPQNDRVPAAFAARREPLDDNAPLVLTPGTRVVATASGARVVRWDGALADLVVDPHTGGLLAAVDGHRRTSGLVREAIAASGADAPDADARLRSAVRELVDAAVLLPVTPPAAAQARDRALPPPAMSLRTGPGLTEALQAARFRAEPLAELLGTSPTLLLRASDLPVYPLRVPDSGLGALTRLLLLGLPVRPADLPAPLHEQLSAAGLAVADGDRLLPTVQLVPHGDLLIASDLLSARDRADVVVGVQPPTATLADLTPRRPVGRALDVGTGCGLQAILLARHARSVTATDVNPRALEFAAANAALAGVTVDLRQGAWFEPVEGERFDLIVSNPPYVLSPDSRWTFRDAGLPRDGASRLVAQSLPAHLADGGIGLALLSWVVPDDGPPPPLSWSSRQGCDAVLLASGAADAWTTATAWNGDQREPALYAREVERWLDWLRHNDIEALEYGALVLHRTGGSAARRIGLPGRPTGPAGEQVLRLLAPVDLPTSDSVLLPAPDVVLEQQVESGPDGWSSGTTSLRQASGLGLNTSVGDEVAEVLSRLAPGRTLLEAVGDDVTAVLPQLTRLLAVGLLVRSG